MQSFCPDGSVRVPGKLCSRRMTDDNPSEIDAAGDVDITAKKQSLLQLRMPLPKQTPRPLLKQALTQPLP